MTSPRIASAFQAIRRRGKPGIIPFLTVGFPSVEATLQLVPALEAAGASLVELGVPFSDPVADGPTIQRASLHALAQGVTLEQCLGVCQALRQQGVTIALVLMGYYNPILSYGITRFAGDAAAAGADGVIAADLPPEEAGPLREACGAAGLDLIPLLAPTSTEERIARACAGATGFIYCISLAGVTGARQELPPGVADLAGRVRAHTRLPLAIGFGISRRQHVEAAGQWAEAAIVGSALLNVIDSTPKNQMVERAGRFIARLAGSKSTRRRGRS